MNVHSNKYPYAYDEFNNVYSIEDAVKSNIHNWYLYPNKKIQLILVFNNKIQQDHWRTLSNQTIILDGVKYEYSYDKDSESFEHKQFKLDILKKQFINIKDYKVFLLNTKEEITIVNSKFRADVMAELMCGTKCVIEIIKTSEISDKKNEFIEDNDILTFKIYIDENGNQIHRSDNIIGIKRKIEERSRSFIESYEKEIIANTNMERKIYEIAKNFKEEWFGYRPNGVSKINHILYKLS